MIFQLAIVSTSNFFLHIVHGSVSYKEKPDGGGTQAESWFESFSAYVVCVSVVHWPFPQPMSLAKHYVNNQNNI